jgi:putative phage-type endonuclease
VKLVTHNQGSDAWKAWRKGGLGGSDVAAVLGVSPYPDHTRAAVFAEKVHGVEREANFAMHRGQRLEPSARLAYTTRELCTAAPVCVEMDGCPWARVSLDGLCRPDAVARTAHLPAAARERALRTWLAKPAADADRWILELKCPSWETHDLALNGVVPEHFEAQCQWQMLVCGLDRLDFASFNPHERFTPEGWPLLAKWRALPKGTRERPKPTLLDLWLALAPPDRPPMPAEWLSVHAIAPDAAKQAEILEVASRFWFEVCEARAALPPVPGRAPKDWSKVEAEFA